MKRILLSFLLFTLILVGVFAQAVPFTTGEWAPFTGASLPGQGIATEVVMAICKVAGIEAQLAFYPWPRAEAMVGEGTAFAAFPYALNDERKAKYLVSDPIFYNGPKIIYDVKANPELATLKVSSLADLVKYPAVLLSGSHTLSALKAAGIILHEVATLDSAVKVLQSGRAAIFIEEPTVGFDAIRTAFPASVDQFKTLDFTAWPAIATGLIVSKTYPGAQALLDKFNVGLAIIKKNGVYAALAAKYRLITKL